MPEQVPQNKEKKAAGKQAMNVGNWIRRNGVVFGISLLVVVISVLRPEFLSLGNLKNLLRQISMLGILSIGLTFTMIVGEVDLSFGEVAGLIGVFVTKLFLTGLSFPLSLLSGLSLGTAFGVMNGLLTVKVRIPSFITTIASMSLAIGINFLLTHGQPVYGHFPSAFNAIGRGYVLGIPVPVIILFLVIVIAWLVAERMAIGRYMYATGGNITAAFHSGIRVDRYRIFGMTLSGVCAAIAGIILASRLGSGQPTAGSGFLLDAFAASFLGTTVFKQGLPNIFGTVVGVIALGILSNGMTLLGMPYETENVIKAVVLIGAVALARLTAARPTGVR